MPFNNKVQIFKWILIGLLNHITLILYLPPITEKKQKVLDIRIFYDSTQISLAPIFQYLTLSQCNRKEILPTIENNFSIYQRSNEILKKIYKLLKLHMLTQKITFVCHWKDTFGNDIRKRTKEGIEVRRLTCLQAVQDKTITIETLWPDKIRRLN